MARRKTIPEDVILKAKEWLASGGTKKGACEILGVSNNKTMESQIEEYDNKLRIDKEIRARKRKEPVLSEELSEIITDHLIGYSMQELSELYFRSTDTIKHHLVKNGALMKQHAKIDQLKPPMLPDQCIAEAFDVGQYVWSAKYNCIARVMAQYKNAYRLRVWGDGIMQYAYQAPYELGDLSHLEKLGVNLGKLSTDVLTTEEIAFQVNKTLLEANKRTKELR
jgi:hypothetical protein